MNDMIELSVEEQRKRKSRNKAIGWLLFGLVVLFYVVSVLRLAPNIGQK
jgi:hypothetical protein